MSRYVWLSSISLVLFGLSASAANRNVSSGQLLVANKGDSSLGIVNPQTDQQVTTIPEEGYTAHEVAASADGRLAFVPIYGSSGVGQPGTNGQVIDVMDLASRKIISKIDFGHGVRPHCAVLDRADGLLYVTTELDQELAVIDPKTFKIIGRVPTGQPESHMLAISPDGKRGYTANVGPGTVSVLDLPNRKVIKIIQIVPKDVQRIAVSTDGKWVFTSDQAQPRLAVIDTSTNTLKTWVDLPDVAYGTAVTPDGKWLLLTQPKTSKVAVLDLATMKVTKTLAVPKSPQEIVVDPDGSKAYVSCSSSNKVAVINLDRWQTETPIDAGKGVDGMAWAGE